MGAILKFGEQYENSKNYRDLGLAGTRRNGQSLGVGARRWLVRRRKCGEISCHH